MDLDRMLIQLGHVCDWIARLHNFGAPDFSLRKAYAERAELWQAIELAMLAD